MVGEKGRLKSLFAHGFYLREGFVIRGFHFFKIR